MDNNEALAEFLEAVGAASLRLADVVRTNVAAQEGVSLAAVAGEQPTASYDFGTIRGIDIATLDLGPVQRLVVDLPGMRGAEEGMKAGEVTKALHRTDQPNIQQCLLGLEKRKIVERVPQPNGTDWNAATRWRLTARYR